MMKVDLTGSVQETLQSANVAFLLIGSAKSELCGQVIHAVKERLKRERASFFPHSLTRVVPPTPSAGPAVTATTASSAWRTSWATSWAWDTTTWEGIPRAEPTGGTGCWREGSPRVAW